MYRHTGGFVDNDYIFIFMHDADGLRGNGWFVAVEGMAYNVAVFYGRLCGLDGFAVELDCAG